MGYPVALAGAFSVLGIGPWGVEALNLVLAAITTALVWDIGRITWSPRVGAVAAMGYALTPSAVLMTLVPLTEPLYTAIAVAVVRLGIGGQSGWPLWAAATGAVLALAQYVRATALILLAAVVAIAFLAEPRLSRAVARSAVITLVFLVLLAPTISYNLEQHGDLSISTSAYGGWTLFVGSNQKSSGMWNPEDAALLQGFPGETIWDKSEHAGGLAWERYTRDARATLDLLVRKAGIMWGDERYAAAYALPTTESRGPTRDMWVGWLTSQVAWSALLMLAVVGTWRERRSRRPAVLLVGLVLLGVAASHLVLEVHSRYHAYVVPLLWLLAAAGIQHLRRRASVGRPSEGPRRA
jgi:4-amino-4-deoxy-L-arabinose transferase-like glycosyltransferase